MSGGRLSRLYRGETRIEFLGKRRIWFAISGMLLAVSILSLATKGLAYGIEFKGGVSIQAPVSREGDLAAASDAEITSRVKDALAPLGAEDAVVQVAAEGDDRSVIVQTKEVADPDAQAEVVAAVSEAVDASPAATDSQRIGSKWGAEITDKAIRALVIFLLVTLAFISWRFEWKMAVAAILALVHDLLITAGVYSIVGFEVTPSTIIALLTILGYSLYDTVVVFDKLEEHTSNLAATGRMTYQDSANLAMNQVFMRSLNTSLTTLLPVAALLFVGAGLLGAETLRDLALALFVGIMAGTYSSIFFATPILAMMKEREPKYRSVRDKVLREAQRAAALPSVAPARAAAIESPDGAPAKETSRPAGTTRTATRAPVGSKKAKRRKRR